jgi:Fur family zinc uptake transcriptional regulator
MTSSYTEQALQLLQARGVRQTKPRRLVLEALESSDAPVSAYDVAGAVRRLGGVGDVVTVYRILDLLEREGLVHRLVSSGKLVKCQLGPEDACDRHQLEHCHHSLVCRSCGRIDEVHCPGVSLLAQALAAQTDFQIEGHVLEFSGLCDACRAR